MARLARRQGIGPVLELGGMSPDQQLAEVVAALTAMR
jgi:hypothetical protein